MAKKSTGVAPSSLLAGCALILLAAAALHAADTASPEDVFKQKGLSKVGFLLITAQEADVRTAATYVRSLKSKVTYENSSRASLDRTLQTAQDALVKLESQLGEMHTRMDKLKGNPSEYNKLVSPYNATLAQVKLKQAAWDDLSNKLDKIDDSQPACNEGEIAADQVVDATMANYAALAKDAEVTAAIARFNKGTAQPTKLGPSGNCLADAAFIKKCISDMAADGIPVKFVARIPRVEVIINGKRVRMMWDSGASTVFLSAESADELGIVPTANDETVTTSGSDGHEMQVRLIIIPEIRVGPFTARNVEAVVAPKGIPRGADLLGQAFQRHFLCRLDPEASVLRLTPNPDDGPPGARDAVKHGGPAAAGDDLFKAKGLAVVGNLLVTQDEAEIHNAVLALRGLKMRVASEATARAGMSHAVENAAVLYFKVLADMDSLLQQMDKVKNNKPEYIKLLDPYNALAKQIKTKEATYLGLQKKMGRMDDSQSLYTEAALASAKKANALQAAYGDLAKDPTIKAAVEKYNKSSNPPVALGPSADFSTELAFLRQTLQDIAAEGIPIRIEGGVPNVDVTINGRTVEMVWDSGASLVSLSAKTAADLGLRATDSDRTTKMTGIDGRPVECKVINVPAISVGGYTAHDVECVIHPPSDDKCPDLLGATFQVQFLCKLDRQAGLLHLTPNDRSAAAKP